MGNSCTGAGYSKAIEKNKDPNFPWLSDEYGAASLHCAEFPPLTNQQKMERLKTVKLFILDNSVRESTVAQNRGHTFADKFKILDNVYSCKGIKHQLIATFVRKPRVDDLFVKEFNSKPRPEYSGQNYYCFSELFDTVVDGIPSLALPVGCQRAAEYGIKNIMLELDLMNPVINWEGMDMNYYYNIYRTRFDWIRANVNKDAHIFVNIRDFSFCWDNEPRRVAGVIHYLSTLPKEVRIFGLVFEDPLADVLPMSVCEQARRTRAIMNAGGWTDAHFLCHIHYGFGLAEATILEFIIGGGDGMWGSISRVGAASGHANSLTTVYNLHRLGNKYVQETYSLPNMRKAAIEITRITTGKDPDSRTELYGSRAIDKWLECGSVVRESIGTSMEVVSKTRISILATPDMVRDSLVDFFGPRDGSPPLLRKNIHAKSPKGRETEQLPYIKEWDLALCQQMLNVMHQDLKVNRKEEVDTAIGLCSLYERAGGIPDAAMLEVIAADQELNNHKVLKELQEYYETWVYSGAGLEANSMKTTTLGDEDHGLSYEQFYEAFLKEELTSFDSPQTKEVFHILDFDHNGVIDWHEIVYRVKWVLQEYPDECSSIQDTIHCLYENYLELEVEHHKRQQLTQKRMGKWRAVARQIMQEVPRHRKSIEEVRSGNVSQEDLSAELLSAIPGIPPSREPSREVSDEPPARPSPQSKVPNLPRPQSRPFIPPIALKATEGGGGAGGDAEGSAAATSPLTNSSESTSPKGMTRIKSIRFVPPGAIEVDSIGVEIADIAATVGIAASSTPSNAHNGHTISPSKVNRFIPPSPSMVRQRSRSNTNNSDVYDFWDSSSKARAGSSASARSFYVTADGRRHASSQYFVSEVTSEQQMQQILAVEGVAAVGVAKGLTPKGSMPFVISVIEEDTVYEEDD